MQAGLDCWVHQSELPGRATATESHSAVHAPHAMPPQHNGHKGVLLLSQCPFFELLCYTQLAKCKAMQMKRKRAERMYNVDLGKQTKSRAERSKKSWIPITGWAGGASRRALA